MEHARAVPELPASEAGSTERLQCAEGVAVRVVGASCGARASMRAWRYDSRWLRRHVAATLLPCPTVYRCRFQT